MPVSALDQTPALVVIDVQKGLMSVASVHPVEDIVDRAARLAAAFRRHRLPVVLVSATGRAPGRTEADLSRGPGLTPRPYWADLVDELDPQPDDHLVTKERWEPSTGRRSTPICGGAGSPGRRGRHCPTSIGVESTARAAFEHGYHVVLATDAMADRNRDAHQNSIERICPRLGETASTAEILDLLERTR